MLFLTNSKLLGKDRLLNPQYHKKSPNKVGFCVVADLEKIRSQISIKFDLEMKDKHAFALR